MESFQKVQPVEFKCLILPEEAEEKSEGGIFIPQHALDREQYSMQRGTVVAFGEGFFTDIPGPAPKVGDKVIFDKYAGATIHMDVEGKRRMVRLCNDKNILAIIREE